MGAVHPMSSLQRSLRAAFDSLSTGLPWSGDMAFVPHPRVGKGDFSSSVAIQVAAQRKVPAQDIVAQLLPTLSAQVPGEWYEDNGFIVVRGSSSEWWSDECRTLAQTAELLSANDLTRSICVVPPANELPSYAAVRLVALGAFQALMMVLSGSTCVLSLAGEPLAKISTIDGVARVFGDALQRILYRKDSHLLTDEAASVAQSLTPRVASDQDVEDRGRPAECFVWIAHHTSGSSRGGLRDKVATLRRTTGVSVRMPNDGWLISRERAIPEILTEPYLRETLGRLEGTDALLRGIMHAASTTPSALYDPAVAQFDELTSLWYSLTELRDRMSALVPTLYVLPEQDRLAIARGDRCGIGSTAGDLTAGDLAGGERELWFSAMRVPYRLLASQGAGEVGECVLACEDFCELSHRFLNQPSLRLRLVAGDLNYNESKILAGISLGLSSILGKVYEQGLTDNHCM